MTTRERLERKLEKRQEWSRKAYARSEAAFNASHDMLAPIPLGQPNINGALTSVLKRSDSAMRRSCEEYDRAQYRAEKARGLERALENNIYSDDENAAERLAEKIASLEKVQEAMRIAGKVSRDKKLTDAEKRDQIIAQTGFSDADFVRACYDNIATIIQNGGCPRWAMSNNNANIRRLKIRLDEVTVRARRIAAAEQSENGVAVENTASGWCFVTFEEKPEREILDALKGSGFRWSGGSWCGRSDQLPECVKELL